jgi:spermidine/putrescine-binding protein
MRRVVFAVAIALAGLAPASAADRVVHVYNWSDYIDPKVFEDFTTETGVQVVYDTFDSNDVLETKLLAGKTGYDVVVPSASYLQRLVGADIFLKLDTAKIPNLKYAWPEITARLATYDPGNLHAVNYMWGTTGIGFNVIKAKERLGNQPMNTWDIVFKPELLAKFKSCGVNVIDAADEIIPAALNSTRRNTSTGLPAATSASPWAGRATCTRRRSAPRRRRSRLRIRSCPSTTRCPRRARSCGSIPSQFRRTRRTSKRLTPSSTT